MHWIFKKILSFRKSRNNIFKQIQQLSVGDLVYIKFVDPKHMGYVNLDDAFGRFDSEDLINNDLHCQITKIKLDKTLDHYILEFISVKRSGKIKNQMLISSEILELETFRKVKKQ